MKTDRQISSHQTLKQTRRKRQITQKAGHKFTEIQAPMPAGILLISTFPPTECGIATYSEDLVGSLSRVYGNSCRIIKCPIQTTKRALNNETDSSYSLDTNVASGYAKLAVKINKDFSVQSILIQHEFGLFDKTKHTFLDFLCQIEKPIAICFHTVLPNPDSALKAYISRLVPNVDKIIVMTQTSKDILIRDYNVTKSKISLINHGTHLIAHKNKTELKVKYGLTNKTVLSTFGLLGPGKSIETTLKALPKIVLSNPEVKFLILGKTHPSLIKTEGESYRHMLRDMVQALNLESHVIFINEFLPLHVLLEYLQLTDIYLFTSKDPNQAVSGTFSYAMSCGCPIISTPIPHAVEFLSKNKGLLFDFENSSMLSTHIRTLLNDNNYRKNLGLNGLHGSSATCWENSALAHGQLLEDISEGLSLNYEKPEIKLDHLFRMTTEIGIIQFSKLNQPDISSGYTLDDNARALIAVCEMYRLNHNPELLDYLRIYCSFILNCQRHDGSFLNYVDENKKFTEQNNQVNLEDSNGRAIWALGHFISLSPLLPKKGGFLLRRVTEAFNDFIKNVDNFNSPRAMSFIVKGIKISGRFQNDPFLKDKVIGIAEKLSKMYVHESQEDWNWFESYLTYGNSVLPEAMLMAYEITNETRYRNMAHQSFDFLLKHLFKNDEFRVISNQTWFLRGDDPSNLTVGGEQPIDVAYTILALKNFHEHFPKEAYDAKMELAFNWFMGHNHLKQIVYNPCTTGCFDGLEKLNVNLNQGAESTVSYLLARLAFEKINV